MPTSFLPIAATESSLLGGQSVALLALLVAVTALAVAISALRRSKEPAPSPAPVPAKPAVAAISTAAAPVAELTHETLALIAACVAMTYGHRARVASVSLSGSPGELPMQQWSIEGRRQIYSSHQVR